MASPREKKKAYWKRKPGRPKESRNIILKALEKSPDPFEELLERTGLARTTFSEELKKLDEEKLIERRPAPPKIEGRGRRHRLLICATAKAHDPVEMTLRHLSVLTAIPQPDVEEGRKFLTPKVVETINEIVYERYDSTRKIIMSRFPSEVPPPPPTTKTSFDEFTFTICLAIYCIERNDLPRQLRRYDKTVSAFFRKFSVPEMELLKKELKKPKALVALPIIRKKGLTKHFDELLKWFEPLTWENKMLFATFLMEHQSYPQVLMGRLRFYYPNQKIQGITPDFFAPLHFSKKNTNQRGEEKEGGGEK